MTRRVPSAALMLAVVWPCAGFAQDALSLSCPVCHGTREAPSRMPSFYDLDAQQISDRLWDFRGGARTGTAMPRLAVGMSDAEIDALSRYYGKVRP